MEWVQGYECKFYSTEEGETVMFGLPAPFLIIMFQWIQSGFSKVWVTGRLLGPEVGIQGRAGCVYPQGVQANIYVP